MLGCTDTVWCYFKTSSLPKFYLKHNYSLFLIPFQKIQYLAMVNTLSFGWKHTKPEWKRGIGAILQLVHFFRKIFHYILTVSVFLISIWSILFISKESIVGPASYFVPLKHLNKHGTDVDVCSCIDCMVRWCTVYTSALYNKYAVWSNETRAQFYDANKHRHFYNWLCLLSLW